MRSGAAGKPHLSVSRSSVFLLCALPSRPGCWCIQDLQHLGRPGFRGHSIRAEGAARTKAQRQEYAKRVGRASWWGSGRGFRSKSRRRQGWLPRQTWPVANGRECSSSWLSLTGHALAHLSDETEEEMRGAERTAWSPRKNFSQTEETADHKNKHMPRAYMHQF